MINKLKADYHRLRVGNSYWDNPSGGYGLTPIKDDGSYNYTGLFQFINVTLDAKAIPEINFAEIPSILNPSYGNDASSVTDAEPPDNATLWGQYCLNVTKQICLTYGNSTCESWKYTALNEPTESAWGWTNAQNNASMAYGNCSKQVTDWNPRITFGGINLGGVLPQNSTGWNITRDMFAGNMSIYTSFFSINSYFNGFFSYTNYLSNPAFSQYSERDNSSLEVWFEYLPDAFFNKTAEIEDMLNELTPPLVTLDPDSKFAKMVTGYYKRLIALKETGE